MATDTAKHIQREKQIKGKKQIRKKQKKEDQKMKRRLAGLIAGALMVTLISATAVFAAENTDKDAGENSQTVTMEEAVEIALKDAEVTDTDAAVYKKVWEYSDNTEKYEIGFIIPGQMEYDYDIEVATGKILENDKEVWEAEDDTEFNGLTAGKTADPEAEKEAVEAAVEAAFKDAGVTADDVVVCKRGIDLEDGKEVYVVDFLQEGKTKYEYEIAAADGAIVSREQEPWEKEDDLEYKGLLHPEAVTEEEKTTDNTAGITNTEAKDIALKDSGLSEEDVKITKCRIDIDDGIEKYEVEFRTADGVEYEYEIDIATGKILDKDIEKDDD